MVRIVWWWKAFILKAFQGFAKTLLNTLLNTFLTLISKSLSLPTLAL
ncbi:MAG: hypothetical protein OXN83_04815 [Oligoflexia bacterium]|nr:hypothetical protein [Oligoflexia bacterium]